MHSSRMRTGRALTVSGGWGVVGWLVHPRNNFLGEKKKKKLKKKNEKKNLEHPPRKFQTPPKNWRPPEKFQTPPEKLETRPQENFSHPPETLETPPLKFSDIPLKNSDTPRDQTRYPPPPVDRHTPLNLLPWPNFVAAGNKNAFQWDAYLPLQWPSCHWGGGVSA